MFGAAHCRFKHPGEQIILCSLSSIGAAHSEHHLSGEQVIQKITSLPSSSCTPKEWVKAACEDGSLGSAACICCLDDEVEGRFKLNVLRGSFNQKISSTPVHKMETISYDFCSEPPSRERILTQPDFWVTFITSLNIEVINWSKIRKRAPLNAQPYICLHYVPLCNKPICLVVYCKRVAHVSQIEGKKTKKLPA